MNKNYVVVESWYTSNSYSVQSTASYLFSTKEEARKYIKEDMKKCLDWYLYEYCEFEKSDKENIKSIKDNTTKTMNAKDGFYGLYPDHGEKRYWEYNICEVEPFNKVA